MGIKEKITGLSTKALFMIGALAVIATAATVAYLSTMATATANVQSPFSVQFSAYDGTPIPLTTAYTMNGLHGGDSFSLSQNVSALANNPVTGNLVITCGDGAGTMTCNQTSAATYQIGTGGTPVDVTGLCAENGGSVSMLVQSQSYPVGYSSNDTFAATLVPGFLGNLSCSIQMMSP